MHVVPVSTIDAEGVNEVLTQNIPLEEPLEIVPPQPPVDEPAAPVQPLIPYPHGTAPILYFRAVIHDDPSLQLSLNYLPSP